MVFNAVRGNDDDHVRDHAVVYRPQEGRWRLAPAFDAVPDTAERPTRLTMQLSAGRVEISRASVLADAARFGFDGRVEAGRCLDDLLDRIAAALGAEGSALEHGWRAALLGRSAAVIGQLRAG